MKTSLAFLALSIAPLAAAEPPESFRFEVTTVAEDFARPMGMTLTPGGQVLLIELNGRLSLIDPATGARAEAGNIDVFAEQENGLLGITLDPNFEKNRWLYLHYSPTDFVGQHISRFVFEEGKLDRASEKIVLKWQTQRRECCHHGGTLAFGPDGCLYASTGDNTHPSGDSHGYAPIDRREGREPWNAEKSSANPNDLRGSIIRIRPLLDGTYEIPDGNLFPPGTPGTRPELYVTGCRNPWKMSIDPATGYVYWGEVGPDAGGDGERGPRGYDEINQARAPGFFGWPYFIANNQAYNKVDHASGTIGAKFDPAKPINNSPLNTGRQELPPAQPAFLYWPYGDSKEWPELGKGGRTACAGPVFHHKASFAKSDGFPEFFDNCLLFWDWHRPFIKWARLDKDSNFVRFENFDLPTAIKRPSNAIFAPDGTLYFLDFGSSWNANKDAKLLHIRYRRGDLSPVAKLRTTPANGALPMTIQLDGSASTDPEGEPLNYRWSVNPSAGEIPSGPRASVVIKNTGDHVFTLTVTDAAGQSASASATVVAGNTPPKITIGEPLDGAFYEPGEQLPFRLHIADAEDGDSDQSADRFVSAVVTLAERQRESPGLAAIRASDCFNCHHASQKLVGPAFTEIAARYRGQPDAFEQSVRRVIHGSTGAWGQIPMLPHTNLTTDQVRSMVRWIYDLELASAPQVARGVRGTLATPSKPASLELSANFTDASQGGGSPLSGSATIRVHAHQVEVENYDANNGTKTKPIPGDADGGKMISDVNDSHWLDFHRYRIAGSKTASFRIAAAGPGGKLRLHVGDKTLAEVDVKPTGDWSDWREITVPLENVPDGAVNFRLSFNHRGNQKLMNVDWVRFNP